MVICAERCCLALSALHAYFEVLELSESLQGDLSLTAREGGLAHDCLARPALCHTDRPGASYAPFLAMQSTVNLPEGQMTSLQRFTCSLIDSTTSSV